MRRSAGEMPRLRAGAPAETDTSDWPAPAPA